MIVILTGFTLFHFMVGLACLAAGVRLLTPEERALWRSRINLLVAELLVWLYPILAFVAVRSAWRADADGAASTIPLLLSPIAWLVLMGIIFAIVDFAEDGVLGNARESQ